MRSILAFSLAVAVVAAALVMTGCSSPCNQNGSPVLSLRNPLLIDREVPTSAGERLRYIPQPAVLAVPSWTAIQAPNACAPCPPAFTAPNPCGGQGTGVPESIPAVRR